MMVVPEPLHFGISHYNEKVRWALDYKRLPHRRTALVAGFHVPRVYALTRQTKVPVLILDGRAIPDSTAIIAELERLRPEPALYPEHGADRERALAIEEHFDEEVAPDLRRLFWSAYIDDTRRCADMATNGMGNATRWAWRALFPLMRPMFRRNMGIDDEQLAAARERLGAHIDRLESEIGASGYLVGNSFSIADLSAASVLTAVLRPREFPYPLPEPWPEALVALRDSIVQRPGCQWVLDIYRRHRSPSAEM
jgi:glutathione S-transferase